MNVLIYTVGKRHIYLAQLEVGSKVIKRGKDVGYQGGCAFETIEAAERYIVEKFSAERENYGVFGLDAIWGIDTEPSAEVWYHNLIVPRPIVALDISSMGVCKH
ncbi:hypothetical protein FKG94_06335 [Exilibacterium tricleocarpae]|uniref:DUF3990 domain-containing protein n=1 Tax=Exilibacterium tricleocarpae TaxID=2591008 RepID=A0A545U456_9GAMM|nr:hypothetical protein [Exilibacterium tricleocarpae]TQV84271.1 hypothetical protein FKG94_06335 [Exilibacterium tricleocarpae]